ncbi:MAG: hypothetical protein KGI79_01920 [Patescibacteria group bacterium]|nr:hypothetical protein [Patescibacteria group bacterium]MDE2116609.1 hypothetical protein [Patescibacteria group bacterium]
MAKNAALFRERYILAYVGSTILIVASVFSYMLYPKAAPAAALSSADSKSFQSGRFGIFFMYPENYRLDERDLGGAAPLHFALVLKPSPGSSSSGGQIVIDMYEDEPEYMTAGDFVRAYPDLAMRAIGADIASSTRGYLHGLEFPWSPPYQGRTFVVARKGFIYAFSLVGADETSAIGRDFDRIVATAAVAR